MMRYRVEPIRSSEGPTVSTEELCVDDLHTGQRYIVVVLCVDFRPIRSPISARVARFTKKEDAPSTTGALQLCTPDFYRKLEGGDDFDGAQAADMSPMIATNLRASGIWVTEDLFTASGTLASPKEPWILCTSIMPAHTAGATSLECEFSGKGSDAVVTAIVDRDDFARQLGIDVAQRAAKAPFAKEDAFDLIQRHLHERIYGADKEIDALVKVVHGPVHYEDITLTVRSAHDIAKPAVPAWFTKRTRFSRECEYRFAVLAGCPATPKLRLDVSPELSRLTRAWRFGERWWSS